MIILTLIGVVLAAPNSFILDNGRCFPKSVILAASQDIDLFDYDAQDESQEPDTDQKSTNKRQYHGYEGIEPETIEV